MGCGQSKIHLYPRKSKSKANGKKSGHVDSDADADEEEGHADEGNEKDINRDKDNKIDDENTLSDGKGSPEPPNGEISVSLLRSKNLSLLQSQELSNSQQNFFRMLDKKIEEGPDYDSSSETEIALEEARLNALVQHWESASLTASLCSSASRSLQTTPVRQVPIRQPTPLRNTAAMNSISQQHLQQQQQQQFNTEYLAHHTVITQPGLLGGGGVVGIGMGQMITSQTTTLQQPLVATILSSSQTQLLGKVSINSPKRGDPRTTIISQQTAGIHQPYGSVGQPPPPPIPTSSSVSQIITARPRPIGINSGNIPPTHMQMAYYGQTQPQQQSVPSQNNQSYFGESIHPMQVPAHPSATAATEYRFPPAISVQRLAPQVQRQIRETQELIKDSCPQLYSAGYGSPGPPLRAQPRQTRRPTLESQYSQELS